MQGKNKIDFIICTNDRRQCEDCISYLDRLFVPGGMSAGIITLEGESGLCAAYHKGMRSSDAAYKVYLHQDTCIINRNFIPDMLACFARHPKAGMLGMIGRKDFRNRKFLYQNEPFGALFETRVCETVRYFHYTERADEKVLYLDGLLMMTRADLPWREDIFRGWHFYDVSQSFEMLRAGYELYVPYMKEPWVLHDCGMLSVAGYAGDREKAWEEYGDIIEKGKEDESRT